MSTIQQKLAKSVQKKYADAEVKKIDQDNYLDIHLPSVHPKKGTHLGFNTAKSQIKIVFYCRDEAFVEQVATQSQTIEQYAQGLRIKDNPPFEEVKDALNAAFDFLDEIVKCTQQFDVTNKSTVERQKPAQENAQETQVSVSPLSVTEGLKKTEAEPQETEVPEAESDFPQLDMEDKPYKEHLVRFLQITEKTGLFETEIKVEPDLAEREELWICTRAFLDRIYALDKTEDHDAHEMNILCTYSVIALHWCDILSNDNRFSFDQGRYRRDTIALAICCFLRIDRKFKYYDHVKSHYVMPHVNYTLLSSILQMMINTEQDSFFGLFSADQARKAQQLFLDLDKDDHPFECYGQIDLKAIPEDHPLMLIWLELFKQFQSIRIPYQFVKSYISQIPPQRSFFQKLFTKTGTDASHHVSLLPEDKEQNLYFLDQQIQHKEFPGYWTATHDLFIGLIYFSEQSDGEISAIEKSTIIGRIKEWYEADGQENIDAHLEEVFKAAESVYKSDPSSERFAFALENIRRQFLVNYEWDQEKTHTQLLNVVKDFISVAAADDQVVEKEAELIQLIMQEWDISSKEIFGDDESDKGDEQSSATQSAEQTNDEKQEPSDDEKGFPAISVFQFDDETINQKRVDYIRDWQMESRVYAHRAGIRAYIPEWIDQLDNNDCCPHFNATELEQIENRVIQHKLIPILNYAPAPFFDHVKRVWWIVPFCIWREDSLSWIMLDKNGLYCAHTEDNNIGQMLSWDSITDMEMEYAYDGDERVNMLTVHMGEDKFLTFAEFVSNEQGSYLAVVKAIYEVRKPTIEASRGQDTWKEGSGGEGFKAFEKAGDLLKEKNWLDNPDRPDPAFFA